MFIGAGVIPSTGITIEKKSIKPISNGNTLYVGGTEEGNYTTIRSAIDNASIGDTVFVFDNSSPYYENVVIDKTINLIGEDKDTTIIVGGRNRDVVYVSAEEVTINGFTIKNSGNETFDAGIRISPNQKHIIIMDNIISNNYYNIYLPYSSNNIITGNNISNNYYGIYLHYSSNNIITGNNISNNNYGIRLYSSSNITITDNTINSNNQGIYLKVSHSNIISGNYITSNKINDGIYLYLSNNNTISDNNISNNHKNGLNLWICYRNTISGNNITNNNKSGIFLQGQHNTIADNNINSNNNNGITLNYYKLSRFENQIPSRFNKIKGNNISNNINGIRIVGAEHLGIYIFFRYSFNNIIQNNFMNNDRDAFFENSILNRWKQNYWNESRILPKPIFGFVTIPLLGDIPWFNVDWHPAKEPYDIGV